MPTRWLGEAFLAVRAIRTVCVRRALLARLDHAGQRVQLGEDVRFYGPECIRLHDDVILAHRVILRAMTVYPWTDPPQRFEPRIEIGRGCFLNNDVQVSCARRVTLAPDVMLAERCFLADNNHGYRDPDRSIRAQPLETPGELFVGEGSWLGANVVVAGRVTIGKHCTIGANSVVLDDIPDYSVAAGNPARVLKRYDPDAREWVRAP